MFIGAPKETKDGEFRMGLTPAKGFLNNDVVVAMREL
jgi:alanine dehydrogenase